MEVRSLAKELSTNEYPGRGIVIGKSADGKYAVTAYFIMGRSENSRNRIFVTDGDGSSLVIAMADPGDDSAVKALGFFSGRSIARRVAALTDIEAAIENLYGEDKT